MCCWGSFRFDCFALYALGSIRVSIVDTSEEEAGKGPPPSAYLELRQCFTEPAPFELPPPLSFVLGLDEPTPPAKIRKLRPRDAEASPEPMRLPPAMRQSAEPPRFGTSMLQPALGTSMFEQHVPLERVSSIFDIC